MSFTSHPFHILKEIQPFAAALVAFGAAGITVFMQRRIAEKQGKYALDVAQKNIDAQTERDKADQAVRRLTCALEIQNTIGHVLPTIQSVYQTAELLAKHAEDKSADVMKKVAPLVYSRPKLMPSLPALSRPSSDVKLLSPKHISLFFDAVSAVTLFDMIIELPQLIMTKDFDVPVAAYEAIVKSGKTCHKALEDIQKKYNIYTEELASSIKE